MKHETVMLNLSASDTMTPCTFVRITIISEVEDVSFYYLQRYQLNSKNAKYEDSGVIEWKELKRNKREYKMEKKRRKEIDTRSRKK